MIVVDIIGCTANQNGWGFSTNPSDSNEDAIVLLAICGDKKFSKGYQKYLLASNYPIEIAKRFISEAREEFSGA